MATATSNDGAKRSPPDSYVCFRCNKKGHWIQDCETRRAEMTGGGTPVAGESAIKELFSVVFHEERKSEQAGTRYALRLVEIGDSLRVGISRQYWSPYKSDWLPSDRGHVFFTPDAWDALLTPETLNPFNAELDKHESARIKANGSGGSGGDSLGVSATADDANLAARSSAIVRNEVGNGCVTAAQQAVKRAISSDGGIEAVTSVKEGEHQQASPAKHRRYCVAAAADSSANVGTSSYIIHH